MVEVFDGSRFSYCTFFTGFSPLWLGDNTVGRSWILRHRTKSGEECKAILSIVVQFSARPIYPETSLSGKGTVGAARGGRGV